MTVLRIILKEFRHQIRDVRANAMLILFPIALMTVLGAALSGVFSSHLSLSNIRMLYSTAPEENDAASTALNGAFEAFLVQAASTGINITRASDRESALAAVRNADVSCFVELKPTGITVYGNARNPTDAGIIRSMVNAFAIRYNAASAIQAAGRSVAATSDAVPVSYVQVRSLAARKTASAMDYYAVTMLTLILLYAALNGLNGVRSEIVLKTRRRILSAPVTPVQFLTGKTFGTLLFVAFDVSIVLVFSHFVLGAYWGTDLLTVGALLVSEAIMAVSFGASLAYLSPTGGVAVAAINAVMPLLVFLGGGYVPLDVMGPAFATISRISPITWINQALFGVIYDGSYAAVPTSLAINLGFATLCIATSVVLSRRERV